MTWLKMKCTYVLGGVFFWAGISLRAANPGDEVVVVYNSRVPESKVIAEEYCAKRQVPTNQVFGFDLPTGEDMTRADYKNSLQFPLAKAIKANKLWHFESQLVPATNNEPARV